MSTAGSEEDSDSTSMSTSEEDGDEDTAADDSEATSDSEEDSDSDSTSTESGSSDSSEDSEEDGGSSSISDSGDTDVSIKSTDIGDAFSLDSAAYYNEDMGMGVRGEVTNTSDSSVSYVQIDAYFYDGEGTRLGEGLDNASDLGAGETYAYDAMGALMPEKADQVESYTISVGDGM